MDGEKEHPSDLVFIAYLAGNLARESEIEAIEAHARNCGRCQVVLAALGAMAQLEREKIRRQHARMIEDSQNGAGR